MIWIEMSRDEDHGGGSWGFAKSIWSPTRKRNGQRWAFWETVSQVSSGDLVLHLRGIGNEAAFVGYSQAISEGFTTLDRPPIPGQWAISKEFYRAYVENFTAFPVPLLLHEIFFHQHEPLGDYFVQNANKPAAQKERLFYVIQNDRLQCLNGAYLSHASMDLLDILLPHRPIISGVVPRLAPLEVATATAIYQLKVRAGQAAFSSAVRQNYLNSCCFPGCTVNESLFLIGSHIARWADEPALRGQTANGLTFCLMHDKAFEKGLFTLDLDYRVWSTTSRLKTSPWAQHNISPAVGKPIKPALIPPSPDALLEHWQRVDLYPD